MSRFAFFEPVAATPHGLAASLHDDFQVTTIGWRVGEPHTTISWIALGIFVQAEEPSNADLNH